MDLLAWEKVARFLRGHTRLLIVALLLVPLIIALAAVLFPDLVWDQFLHRYFWGPIISDAEGRRVEGIREGYNVVNTVVYAALLALGLVALLRLLRRWDVRMDLGLLLASIPFFLLGGTLRALEDTVLFNGLLRVLFITPFVYLLVALLFVVALYVGVAARSRRPYAMGVAFASLLIPYYLAPALDPEGFNFVLSPFLPLLLALAIGVLFRSLMAKGMEPVRTAVLSVGLFLFLLSVAYLARFPSSPEWVAAFAEVSGRVPEPHYLELLIVPLIAVALTAAVALLSKAPRLAVLAAPANLVMYFAHFLDGAATYRGLDLYGYAEKHALPAILASTLSPLIMLPLKFAVVTAVVVLIDYVLQDDLKDRPEVAMGLKYAVVVLGLGPGVRDLVRVALGV